MWWKGRPRNCPILSYGFYLVLKNSIAKWPYFPPMYSFVATVLFILLPGKLPVNLGMPQQEKLTLKIKKILILPLHREELREAMVNFGTRCTDEWVQDLTFTTQLKISDLSQFQRVCVHVRGGGQEPRRENWFWRVPGNVVTRQLSHTRLTKYKLKSFQTSS